MRTIMFLFMLFSVDLYANDIIDGHGTGLIYDENQPVYGRTYSTLAECDNLPAEFDLRDHGTVPPIRDQGSCGSCWSFSQTGSLESAYAYANGKILDLSEQELVSCDKKNYGCQGGILRGFSYQIEHGQGLEADFPYKAANLKCKQIESKVKGTRFFYVGQPDRVPTEKEVMCAMYTSKTIPWTIVAAEGQWGKAPTDDDGIMRICGARNINHAVGLVGWKTVGGKVYFKVRNSWGTKWGSTAGKPGTERGYTLAAHLCNKLNTEVAYIATERTCHPPEINAPEVVTIKPNTDETISLPEAEADTEYVWYEKTRRIGRGQAIFVNQDRPSVFKVIAKNPCGLSEALIKVEVKP